MNILESFRFRKVVNYYGSNGPSIIRISNSPKSLLSSCIPYLIFDSLVLQMNSFSGEFYTNGGFRVHCEWVFNESREKIGLAHTRISYHYYFVEKIEFLLSWHRSDFIILIKLSVDNIIESLWFSVNQFLNKYFDLLSGERLLFFS